MKILISNDDGYRAPGLLALHQALKDLGEWKGPVCPTPAF